MVKLKDGREVYGIIYLIRNEVNNKIYIGQTTRENGFNGRYPYKGVGIFRVLETFIKNDNGDGKSVNKHLLSSIKKYGCDNFHVDEEFDVANSEYELNKLEQLYIKTYKAYESKYGYNNTLGGGSFKASSNSKTKMGNKIVCLNDGKCFKSYKEASDLYDVPVTYIKKSCQNKNFYKNNYNLIRFVKVDAFPKGYKLCACCSNTFVNTTKGEKFCEKCRTKSAKKAKITNSNYNYDALGFRNIYYYKDCKINAKNKLKNATYDNSISPYEYKQKEIQNKKIYFLNKHKENIIKIYNSTHTLIHITNYIKTINNQISIGNDMLKEFLIQNNVPIIDYRILDNDKYYTKVFYDEKIFLFDYKFFCVDFLIDKGIYKRRNDITKLLKTGKYAIISKENCIIETISEDDYEAMLDFSEIVYPHEYNK